MERQLPEIEGPGIKMAREAGLSDEQIMAMGGMWDLLPPNIFLKLKNRSPLKITESVRRYAQVLIAETQTLAEALRGENDLLPEINRRRIADELGRNVESGIIQNSSPESPHPDNNI